MPYKNHAKIGSEPVLLFDNESSDSNLPAELLTISEVARCLKISTSGVRRLQQARKLPFIKIGGSVRFVKSDLVAYLEKMRVDALG